MSACIIISARYNSSRFPGKPLAEIQHRPMIYHVIDNAWGAIGKKDVFVATDDNRISDVVSDYGAKVIMTPSECACSSDRTAEAVRGLDYDVVIDLQGDEPTIKPENIQRVIEMKRIRHGHVINAYAHEINQPDQITQSSYLIDNPDTIKVVSHGNYTDELIYMSRKGIPTEARIYKRQLGIYGFYKNQLLELYGVNKHRGMHEKLEDIHILRLLDHRLPVMMVLFKGKYQSVDRECDIKKVQDILYER